MHAYTPPYTKPTGAYDARKLYDETGKIAAAPDTRLDPVSVMNHRARVMPLVLADLEARIAKGAKDYGEPLTTHNGRDALWDAYEEALDLCLYLRQAIEERIQSVSAISSPEREKVCTCPSGDGSLRWPCPAHMAGHANERIPKWSPKWLNEQVTSGHAKLHGIAELAELVAESQKLGLYDDPIPAESAYLASFAPNADIPEKSPLAGSRIATPAEIDELRDVLTAEELKGFGIGDVDPRHVAKTATTVAASQHPANAEALRMADERTPEDRL